MQPILLYYAHLLAFRTHYYLNKVDTSYYDSGNGEMVTEVPYNDCIKSVDNKKYRLFSITGNQVTEVPYNDCIKSVDNKKYR